MYVYICGLAFSHERAACTGSRLQNSAERAHGWICLRAYLVAVYFTTRIYTAIHMCHMRAGVQLCMPLLKSRRHAAMTSCQTAHMRARRRLRAGKRQQNSSCHMMRGTFGCIGQGRALRINAALMRSMSVKCDFYAHAKLRICWVFVCCYQGARRNAYMALSNGEMWR